MRARFLLPPLLLVFGCATSVVTGSGGSGGSGGDGGSGATGGGGSGATGGGGSGPCTNAADCAGLTDVCNVGTCINGACEKVAANDGVACDDGKQCTVTDTCQNGVCTSGNLKFCGSTDSCHVGYCNPQTDTCEQAPGNDGAACDDGDPCTYDGICQNGACGLGTKIDCSFLDGTCSVGVCDQQLGCVAQAVNDGVACDDGLYCTIGDACAAGDCVGQPNTCAPPGNICLIGTCDEATDSCVAVPGNDGAACNDQSACTTGETCSGGVCGGGSPTNEGGACEDGDPCTVNEVCAAGVCTSGVLPGCVSGDGCCPPGCDGVMDQECACLNPGGGSLVAENGVGANEKYCYNAVDSVQTRAQKACESHFGVGNCCIIPGGYNGQQYGQCGLDGGVGSIHWHWDNHPDGHCDPLYVIGEVVSPGWCGVILGSFTD